MALKEIELDELHDFPNLKMYLIMLGNYSEEETRSWPEKPINHKPDILPRKLDLDFSFN